MAKRYVDAKTFEDFAKNQEIMIQTFNHNITILTDAVIDIKEKVAGWSGEFTIIKRIVWWILGIIAVIIAGGVLGSYVPS